MRHPVCHIETEAEYFHRVDTELIDDMRQRAAFDERRQRMTEACQTEDPRILTALEQLGYDQNNIRLLYIVPLVHVAWIDGSVSEAERSRIIVLATLHGVRENAPAYQQLMGWLDRRPSDEFFQATLRAIQTILQSMPETQRQGRTDFLIRCCREVAFASCGLFGWKSKICLAKRALIREMTRTFEPAGRAAAAGA